MRRPLPGLRRPDRSGHARRAALPAQDRPLRATATAQRRPTTAFTARSMHPADRRRMRRIDRAQRPAAAVVLPAARRSSGPWKRHDHAHVGCLFRLHWMCQRTSAVRGKKCLTPRSSAGHGWPRQGPSYRNGRATVPSWACLRRSSRAARIRVGAGKAMCSIVRHSWPCSTPTCASACASASIGVEWARASRSTASVIRPTSCS